MSGTETKAPSQAHTVCEPSLEMNAPDGPCASEDEVEGLDDEVDGGESKLFTLKYTPEDAKIPTQAFEIQVPKPWAIAQSELIRTVVSQDPTSTEMPLLSDMGKCKDKVLALIDYINEKKTTESEQITIPHPLRSNVLLENENCTEWDIKLIDRFQTMNDLYNLAHVADYFAVKGLLGLVSAKIACEIKGCARGDLKNRLDGARHFEKEGAKVRGRTSATSTTR